MTNESARRWLVLASLVAIAVVFAFFVMAPAIGFPLTFVQSRGLLEIVAPVFLGYLGTATHFFISKKPQKTESEKFLEGTISLLVRGPVLVFAVICVFSIFSFGFSNRIGAPAGNGMSLDSFAGYLSVALSFLAATTSIVVAYLFRSENS